MVTTAMKLKYTCSFEENYDKSIQHIKKQRYKTKTKTKTDKMSLIQQNKTKWNKEESKLQWGQDAVGKKQVDGPRILMAMATHSSILAWGIPWTEEPDGLQSIGCKRQTRLSDYDHYLSD